MARLATNRDTYLESGEIADEALRQFDAGGDVSIRQLASALQVSPAAIYHHFDSRDDIVQAAVGLVWEEIFQEITAETTDALLAAPRELLVEGALVTRRVFARHYQIARFMTVTPSSEDPRLAGGLAIIGAVFERLGLSGDGAGAALFAYATYTLGSIALSASRRLEDDLRSPSPKHDFSSVAARPPDAPSPTPETADAVDRAVIATGHDVETEDRYFRIGLDALLDGLLAAAASTDPGRR